jgi:K+-transporting ATPase ATPase C chain
VRRQVLKSIVMLGVLTIALGLGYPLVVTGLAQLAFSHQANGSLVYRQGKLVGSSLLAQSFDRPDGQPLSQYFQPRPSAAGSGYDAAASGASNLGPSNPLLIGFVPGVNTVGLDGEPAAGNPFATKSDPYCVPLDAQGAPVTTPTPGEKYARTRTGAYVCDPNTVPERTIAYRRFNGLEPDAPVPIDAVTASGSGLDPDISIANALDQAARVARARRLAQPVVVGLVHRYSQGRQWGFMGEPTVNVLQLNLALDRER